MKKRAALISFLLLIFIKAALLLSDNSAPDFYTQELRNPQANTESAARKETLKRWLFGFPSLPINMLKWGLDPTLNYVEESHLVKKIDWFWKEIKKYGFHPETRFTPNNAVTGIGLQMRGDELFKTNETLPFVQYDVIGGYATEGRNGTFADFGGGYKITMPENTNLYHVGRVRYERSPLMNFYGIGPRTSAGDRALYSHEELSLDGRVGYQITQTVKSEGFFKFRHVNIGNGHLEEEFRLKERFDAASVPGIHGTDLINLGFVLSHDDRDMEEDPLRGGYENFQFYFANDVRGGNFHYLKFDLHAARFFQLRSDRRIFALKFFAGRTQRLNDDRAPFFDLQRIGGYGIQPAGSETLRAYRYNRFFDQTAFVLTPEYRYNIWKYGNFSADSVFFVDLGEVAREFHSLGFDKLKVSYGGGLRVKHSRDVFFSFEVAHGNEGTQFYIRTKAPF